MYYSVVEGAGAKFKSSVFCPLTQHVQYGHAVWRFRYQIPLSDTSIQLRSPALIGVGLDWKFASQLVSRRVKRLMRFSIL